MPQDLIPYLISPFVHLDSGSKGFGLEFRRCNPMGAEWIILEKVNGVPLSKDGDASATLIDTG